MLQRVALGDRVSVRTGARPRYRRLRERHDRPQSARDPGCERRRAAAVAHPHLEVDPGRRRSRRRQLRRRNSDAARRNELLPSPLLVDELAWHRRPIGADAPFLPRPGLQVSRVTDHPLRRCRSRKKRLWAVLAPAHDAVKRVPGTCTGTSTTRRVSNGSSSAALHCLRPGCCRTVRTASVPTRCPLKVDPPAAPVVRQTFASMVRSGADVSGAGPTVYGLCTSALTPKRPLAPFAPGVGSHVGDDALLEARVHSPSRFSGAWPSGKATGFGPVIPGSNPGAPANVPP